MAILRMFKNSALELKSLRCITVTAMLIALNLVLKSVTIYLSEDLKLTFSYLALASIGMLFGPSVGFIAGIIT
ncbi:MAG: ECF transporter S component, partial [Ruminiclostridium sp.]|nr:ECF transporter S component [Ruminiclostridium sp.]